MGAIDKVHPGGPMRGILKIVAVPIITSTGVIGSTGCTAAPPRSGDDAAVVKAAIERANRTSNDGRKRADPALSASILAPDFVSMGVDGVDIVGRPANQAALAKMMAERQVTPVSYQAVSDTVGVFGDFAYE